MAPTSLEALPDEVLVRIYQWLIAIANAGDATDAMRRKHKTRLSCVNKHLRSLALPLLFGTLHCEGKRHMANLIANLIVNPSLANSVQTLDYRPAAGTGKDGSRRVVKQLANMVRQLRKLEKVDIELSFEHGDELDTKISGDQFPLLPAVKTLRTTWYTVGLAKVCVSIETLELNITEKEYAETKLETRLKQTLVAVRPLKSLSLHFEFEPIKADLVLAIANRHKSLERLRLNVRFDSALPDVATALEDLSELRELHIPYLKHLTENEENLELKGAMFPLVAQVVSDLFLEKLPELRVIKFDKTRTRVLTLRLTHHRNGDVKRKRWIDLMPNDSLTLPSSKNAGFETGNIEWKGRHVRKTSLQKFRDSAGGKEFLLAVGMIEPET